MLVLFSFFFFFFFNDTATTEIYTLSLHDALPISQKKVSGTFKRSKLQHLLGWRVPDTFFGAKPQVHALTDRKSTRLNSSHQIISYAVFCLKKKKENPQAIK